MDNIKKAISFAKKIDGWLSDKEIRFLYNSAKEVEDGKHIIEIGSWKGKSTVVMGLALKDAGKKKTKIFAIDPFVGSSEHKEVYTYPEFMKNIKAAKVDKYVKPIKLTSEAAFKKWDYSKKIGFLWIDGSHDFELVEKDIKLWSPNLSVDGKIALHDSTFFAGVIEAVNDLIYKKKWFKDFGLVGSITFATKCRNISISERIAKRIKHMKWKLILLIYSFPAFLKKPLKLISKK